MGSRSADGDIGGSAIDGVGAEALQMGHDAGSRGPLGRCGWCAPSPVVHAVRQGGEGPASGARHRPSRRRRSIPGGRSRRPSRSTEFGVRGPSRGLPVDGASTRRVAWGACLAAGERCRSWGRPPRRGGRRRRRDGLARPCERRRYRRPVAVREPGGGLFRSRDYGPLDP